MTRELGTKHAEKTLAERRVETKGLRWHCAPSRGGISSTAEVEPVSSVIGQEDAVEALRFGLEIDAPGQNIYVRGLMGSGRSTLVQRLLREVQPACPLPLDRLYVYNFDEPECPALVSLPRGKGDEFADRVEELITFLKEQLLPSLNSDRMKEQRADIERKAREGIESVSAPFEKELAENELALVMMKVAEAMQPVILPVVDGEPAQPDRIHKLVSEGRFTDADIDALDKKLETFGARFEEVNDRITEIRRHHRERMRALVEHEARTLLSFPVKEIQASFPGEAVARFLAGIVDDVVSHQLQALEEGKDFLRKYRPNLILTHAPDDPCPIVVEDQPSFQNLIGNIDRRVSPTGAVYSDHLMIQGGSLLHADGGYLVIEAQEILTEPGAWRTFIRTLRTGKLEIRPQESLLFGSSAVLKPEPIPINVKVVLIGDPGVYSALDRHDPDFPHLFKVLSDFEPSLAITDETLRGFTGVLARIVHTEKLPTIGAEAVAALAEQGARIAGRSDRITTRFGRVADLAREAAHLCRKAGRDVVEANDVRGAVRRGRRRADLPARRFRERIVDGTIRIQTSGETVGQINGLAVSQVGPLTYGFPARITATIAPGRAGVINIEREAQLSGSIHTKGFYILGGLLRHLLRCAGHPMAFSASVAFEQSYGGIDGDSASGAEMCCLLSALTRVPIRQSVAMTGAIDQFGNIQPIGAATEKIEGFFDVCSQRGELTGDQGVIIPAANLPDLMLREDVVGACSEDRFHVWGVETITEALEVLTGRDAGTACAEDGTYPSETVLALAVQRAGEYWETARKQDGA